MAEPFTREELTAVRADLAEATAGGTDPILAEAFDVVARLFATIDKLAAQAWAEPTRFDPDDRSTWPADGQRVLLWGPGQWGYADWSTAEFGFPSTGAGWRRDWVGLHDHLAADADDLWLPLPPTQGGEL